MPARGQKKPWPFTDPNDPRGMPLLAQLWLEAVTVRGYAESYVQNARGQLGEFILWCQERGVARAADVTKPMIERYQRFLFYLRQEGKDGAEGKPLAIRTQAEKLTSIRLFFRWLARNNYILGNPASEIELPRMPPRRPPEVLTVEEVERVLNHPDVETPYGLRDRAILETFYSTGMRRRELALLGVSDLESTAGIVRVRHGKGRKERIIPIGSRALAWIHRYLVEVRPQLITGHDDGVLFLTFTGKTFWPDNLTELVRRYITAAGVTKPGACHLFRHTMATLMLEHGADIRYIQEMLGHASIQATEIYTHVSIKALKEIHTATHPGASLEPGAPPVPAGDHAREALLSALAAEALDEEER
jgi:integrase/recombinase XerD